MLVQAWVTMLYHSRGGIVALPREQLFDWKRFWLSEAPQFPLSAAS